MNHEVALKKGESFYDTRVGLHRAIVIVRIKLEIEKNESLFCRFCMAECSASQCVRALMNFDSRPRCIAKASAKRRTEVRANVRGP